jgi:hypothetical protein
MPERNLCKEAGCVGCCCRDVYFCNPFYIREVFKWFPGAKKVKNLSKPTEDGVYYDNFLGLEMVRIV